MIILLAVIGALAFFMPPEPVEPPPEPPPIVETVQATAKALPVSVKLEAAAGLACIAVPAYIGFRLARMGQRRKRKETIVTDKAAFVALMRKLETMSLILEAMEKP